MLSSETDAINANIQQTKNRKHFKSDLVQAEKQSFLPKTGFRKSSLKYFNTRRWKVKYIFLQNIYKVATFLLMRTSYMGNHPHYKGFP